MKNEKIIFKLGEETKHIISEITSETINDSIFSVQYKNALGSINDTLSLVKPTSDPDNTINNIFSFIGDRGTGKTSCMMSIATQLINGLDDELKNQYPVIARKQFLKIDRLDPSFFDETHNVLELFLANLYKKFQKEYRHRKDRHNDKADNLTREIFEKFEKAQKNMAEMTKGQIDRDDTLQNLLNLMAGTELWKNINELVSRILEYFELQNGILILPIDDIDLNSRMASEMMEQIRKFLIQPNIIILFAIKMEQLSLAKQMSLTKEYKILLDKQIKTTDVITEMTEAYLSKLLPVSQRFIMPEGTTYLKKGVEILEDEKTVGIFNTIEEMVPTLIFQKTRFLFFNSVDRTSYIIPNNLRELRFLIKMLYDMPPLTDKKTVSAGHTEEAKNNRKRFRHYLYQNWVTRNLDYRQQELLNEILAVKDVARINATVLHALQQNFFKEKGEFEDFCQQGNSVKQVEIKAIFDINDKTYNIALGDVLDIIDIMESSERDESNLKFLFMLRTLYTIYLYELFEESTQEKKKKEGVKIETRFSEYELTEYEKLMAGYFVNTRLSRIIPTTLSHTNIRACRNFNFKRLKDLINEIIESENPDSNKLQLAEFFVLCISRRIDSQNNTQDIQQRYLPQKDFYRKDEAVFYAETLQYLTKNAFFDIGGLFFNLTRIEECFGRIGEIGKRLYDISMEEGRDSLLNNLIENAKQQKLLSKKDIIPNKFPIEAWREKVCPRNAEVLQEFKIHMDSFKSPKNEHLIVFEKAFEHISNFKVPLYLKKQDENSQAYIVYSFLKPFVNVFTVENKELFNEIFTPKEIDLLDAAKIIKNRRFGPNETVKHSTLRDWITQTYPNLDISTKVILGHVFNGFSPNDLIHKEDIKGYVKEINKLIIKREEEE